jgi:hypothetical protein
MEKYSVGLGDSELKREKFRSEIEGLTPFDSGKPMKRNKKIGLICSPGIFFHQDASVAEAIWM